MNIIRKQMLEILKELKYEHNIVGIKAEFEAEGSRTDELIMLNESILRADTNLIIKVGGCEAVRDLDQCRLIGVDGIMAPMIETPFAMQKFISAAKKIYGNETKSIEWIINAETITSRENFNKIIEVGKEFIDSITIGRVDLSASMGLDREQINSESLLKISTELASIAKKENIKVGLGGGISFEAIPFIINISPLIDRFETRKVIFRINDNEEKLKKGILKAMEFEKLYLQNKCEFYKRMANEDKQRLDMLSKRIEVARDTIAQRS